MLDFFKKKLKDLKTKHEFSYLKSTEYKNAISSIYGGWVNPFEPINKGRLGSTQEWRVEKPKKHYY